MSKIIYVNRMALGKRDGTSYQDAYLKLSDVPKEVNEDTTVMVYGDPEEPIRIEGYYDHGGDYSLTIRYEELKSRRTK